MGAKKVLAVDDDEKILQLIKAYLEELDAVAILARGAEEGLVAARKLKPDLILLDLMMPGMPGEEVAATLKEDPATSKIPIVFLTGLADEADSEKKPSGDYSFLSKQLPPAELLKKLKGHIEAL